ncbi:hypothetical protein [Rufibacter immobilis]|uniref:hypothetical protein n=1 Tax=Rufibacter immobilis TaxID=1348778 RepID=UPI001616065E|nr:hypothetical protein [Rufibacter immobilis]
MRSSFLTQVVLFSLLLWAGMVIGISFLEAPVKFTAPQVTLAIGLGIGRLVFGFLNKFELVFCSLVLIGLFYNRASFNILLPALLLALVMVLQTLWLLPALDVRALQIIAGQVPPPSNLHHIYVGMEVFKLGLLLGTASAVYKKLSLPTALQPAETYS